jgi:hypothetical protein
MLGENDRFLLPFAKQRVSRAILGSTGANDRHHQGRPCKQAPGDGSSGIRRQSLVNHHLLRRRPVSRAAILSIDAIRAIILIPAVSRAT